MGHIFPRLPQKNNLANTLIFRFVAFTSMGKKFCLRHPICGNLLWQPQKLIQQLLICKQNPLMVN